MTCPGVPDFYQGSELWDLCLVDPDNRRPVDYVLRRRLLEELKGRLEWAGEDLAPLAAELLAALPEGMSKLFVICRTLNFRGRHEAFFRDSDYQPLHAEGPRRDHICAFLRTLGEKAVVVVVPRLVYRLCGGEERLPLGPEVWQDTKLVLPAEATGRVCRDLFTGQKVRVCVQEGCGGMRLAEVFANFPVALLVQE